MPPAPALSGSSTSFQGLWDAPQRSVDTSRGGVSSAPATLPQPAAACCLASTCKTSSPSPHFPESGALAKNRHVSQFCKHEPWEEDDLFISPWAALCSVLLSQVVASQSS